MNFYILELEECVKIGMSGSLENRISTYKNIKNYKYFYNLDEELCSYLEVIAMQFFNSETEYIYNEKFSNVVLFITEKLKTVISKFTFEPLGIELIINSDGLYKLNNVVDYINSVRAEKGKSQILIADYTRLQQTTEFLDYMKHKKQSIPLLSKKGKYGGTYAIAEVVIDIIMWGDTSTKYNILKWMYDSKNDYVSFLNPATKNVLEVK